MTNNDFDPSDWIGRLAGTIEAVTATMRFSGMVGHLGRILSHEEFIALLNSGNYQLEKTDSYFFWSFANANGLLDFTETLNLITDDSNELFNLIEFQSLSIFFRHDLDITDMLALLREHPIAHSMLKESESMWVERPHGGLCLDIKTLTLNLVKLAIETDSRNAACVLHRFLDLGKRRKLGGYHITLFYGLNLCERLEFVDGIFLAPYKDVEQSYDSPKKLQEIMEMRLPRKGDSITALVRELKWGIFPHAAGEKFDLDSNMDYLFSYDIEVVLNLLSVAVQSPLAIRAEYIGVDRWLEKIDRNFANGWISGGGHPYDGWWNEKHMSEEERALFIDLIRGWQEYKGDSDALSLAVQRLAASYNRPGMPGVMDMILDYATTLEIMYGLDGPELTYKLATRAGYFLGDDAEARETVFGNVRSFYGVRSDIVHGRKGVNKRDGAGEETWKAVENGKDLARRTLFKLLAARRSPSWNKLVMTGSDK